MVCMVERMKRALLVAVTAGVLLLAGCTATEEASSEPAARAAEAPSETTNATEAPLTAASPSAPSEAATPEDAFLEQIRDKLPADTTIPNATDEQLLEAGKRACEQMASGTDFAEVSVIEGEQPNGLGIREDSSLIAAVASGSICP